MKLTSFFNSGVQLLDQGKVADIWTPMMNIFKHVCKKPKLVSASTLPDAFAAPVA